MGNFTRIHPNLESLCKWLKTKWVVKGSVDRAPLPCDFILLYFMQEEDVQWVLQYGPWWFGKSDLVLKKWYQRFRLYKENFNIEPIWVTLPNLPL